MDSKKIITAFYARTNTYGIKIENGIFGKWKNYQWAVTYTRNCVDYFTDYFKDEDIKKMSDCMK